jgi:hypothetical protein
MCSSPSSYAVWAAILDKSDIAGGQSRAPRWSFPYRELGHSIRISVAGEQDFEGLLMSLNTGPELAAVEENP